MVNKYLKKIYLKLPNKYKKLIRKNYINFHWLTWVPQNTINSLYWLYLKDKKINNINRFEKRIYSQNGEDGIIRAIFYKIKTTNKFCVEFGTEDGYECNTRYLIKKSGWKFLHMDGGENLPNSIKREFITAENINDLFKKYEVPKEFDLLSIDIDFNDYFVWKAIKDYNPRVVIIEYNSSIPPTESKVIRYEAKRRSDGTNYFGASLLALSKLGKTKGYTLVACDSKGINAFFIRDDLILNQFEVKNVQKTFRAPKYGFKINGKYIGNPPSNESMITI